MFYYPQKELQANLIGKFDIDTISDHEERFIKGRLATWTPPKPHTEFQLLEKDCSKGVDLGDADSSLDDEILREIMEEEAAKKQEESKRKNVMGSKKKKGKGKPKKGVKEDL